MNEIPSSVREEINVENEQYLKERDEFIKRRDNLTIKVLYLDDSYIVSISNIHFLLQNIHSSTR